MNIVGANSSRGGHYPSQSVVCGSQIKGFALVTTIDSPQRYKKGLGEDHTRHLKTLEAVGEVAVGAPAGHTVV